MLYLKTISKALLLTIMCVAICQTASAQDQTRFVLKLDKNLIDSFRNFRSLRSNVPEEFKGKISFVELQFAETKDAEPVERDLGLTIDGETASINLAETTIETLQGQPIRVPVTGDAASFSQIVLIYDTPVTTETKPTITPITPATPISQSPLTSTPPFSSAIPPAAANPPTAFQPATAIPPTAAIPPADETSPAVTTYFVRLGKEKTMSGTLDGFDQFEITTKFGNITVPMGQVAGIKFHIDNEDYAVVVMKNGDSVTGVPAIPVVMLMTDWGQADIDAKSIESLTTSSTAVFSQETTDFGTRWNLKTGNAVARTASGSGN